MRSVTRRVGIARQAEAPRGFLHPESEPLIRTMAALWAGAPFDPVSYDSTPWEEHARPRTRPAGATPPVLFLLTDLLDFGPKPLTPGQQWFEEFLWAFNYQDTWSISEHAEYWGVYLSRWPKRSGRGMKRDADAFAFALAAREVAAARRAQDNRGIHAIAEGIARHAHTFSGDLDDFATRLTEAVWTAQRRELRRSGRPIRGMSRNGYDLGGMRRLRVLAKADALLKGTPHHLRSGGMRLPRISPINRPTVPSLAEVSAFEDNDRAGDPSYLIRTLASQIVAAMVDEIRHGDR